MNTARICLKLTNAAYTTHIHVSLLLNKYKHLQTIYTIILSTTIQSLESISMTLL